MQPVSQYMVNKQRKELRRLRSELAKAQEAERAADAARHWNRDEKGWRVTDLKEAIAGVEAWLASAVVEKAPNWSPARRARRGWAPLQ